MTPLNKTSHVVVIHFSAALVLTDLGTIKWMCMLIWDWCFDSSASNIYFPAVLKFNWILEKGESHLL